MPIDIKISVPNYPQITVTADGPEFDVVYDFIHNQIGRQNTPRRSIDLKNIDTAILSLCKDGHKIPAIKLYRDVTGINLKSCKTYVEDLYNKNLVKEVIDE